MPRRHTLRQLESDILSSLVDGKEEEKDEDEDEDEPLTYRCPHCHVPFASSSSLRGHFGHCRHLYTVALHHLDDDVSFGGADDGYEAESEMGDSRLRGSYQTISQSRTSCEVAAARKLPQQEGVGYDIAGTYSRGSLSALAKEVLRQERSQNKSSDHLLPDDSLTEDEDGGIIGQDLFLSDSDDSDYSVSKDRIAPSDQDGGGDADEPMQTMNDITDEWNTADTLTM